MELEDKKPKIKNLGSGSPLPFSILINFSECFDEDLPDTKETSVSMAILKAEFW